MIIEQQQWTPVHKWQRAGSKGESPGETFELVLAFGDRDELEEAARIAELQAFYPGAEIISCSTSGEILGESVSDGTITATAIRFEKTTFRTIAINERDYPDSREAGRTIASMVPPEGLVHLFVLSDGQRVNGSMLVQGIAEKLPDGVAITGGLAGDRARFTRTLVGYGRNVEEGNIVAVAFYGENLFVGYGSIGGWDSFGPDRIVTRSEGNVLYELDGQSALELYKRYLDNLADELPGAALLFPLSIRVAEGDTPIVRTILSIDEEAGSMTFAGDIPQGAFARLMKANFDRLIDGASRAAEDSFSQVGFANPELAILISCVGRKLVLGQRTEEEVEAVREVLGTETVMTGFYSYGEISPFIDSPRCELHNQTMTITAFSER